MRIGFASLYSWRPHVEHLSYLANLVRKIGHETYFLTCDGDLSTCYTRELRQIRPDWQECLLCRAGGIRSYSKHGVSSIAQCLPKVTPEFGSPRDWAISSASTLGRYESDEDFNSLEFLSTVDRLSPAVAHTYAAAINWIEKLNIEAVVVFNGRIDATRAVFEAGMAKKIPVVSLERTWFGDGVQLLPLENCLGLRNITRMVAEWKDRPLRADQARKAARLIASRFLRLNHNEWRAYNVDACVLPWPIKRAESKILLIPSSRNETWGHPDWECGWKHPLAAYDALIENFRWDPANLVLRCHPNWSENIGKNDGKRAEEMYTQWARERGIHIIQSNDKTSTMELIREADAVIVASGSAALESAALGKQVIRIAPANYQSAGISEDATSPEMLSRVILRSDLSLAEANDAEERVRENALRFAYAITYRIPQYVEQVRCMTPTSYLYRDDGDPERLIRLFRSGLLETDDAAFAADTDEETFIVELMRQHRWVDLMDIESIPYDLNPMHRRPAFRAVDSVRKLLRHGDR